MLNRIERYARRLAGPGPLADMSHKQRLVARHVRVAFFVARWEVYDRLKLHAQALTYDTLLAVVPLIAVIMAMLKSFGGMGPVADRLEQLIVDNVSVSDDVQQEVSQHIRDFVINIQTGSMGALSILLLIFSVLSLLGHIEFAFNVIFGSKTQRPLVQRMTIYWAVLTLGPMLLAGSFALTHTLDSTGAVRFVESFSDLHTLFLHVLPLIATWVAFTATYVLVPMTQVRLTAALPAAMIAGSLWHFGKLLYAIYAKNAFTVHNIYGSLATIPLFILWIYVSWLLVLFGAQLAFALQHASSYRPADDRGPPHEAARELAACRVFLAIAEDFYMARPATERDSVATRLGLPIHLVEDLLAHLCRHGFVRETEPAHALVPARDLAQVTVAEVLQSLRHSGSSAHIVQDAATGFLAQLLGELDMERQKRAGGVNFHDLAARFGSLTSEPK